MAYHGNVSASGVCEVQQMLSGHVDMVTTLSE